MGDAQAVRGLAVGGGGKVGADPGGQPGARIGALGQQRPVQRSERGVDPVEVAAAVRVGQSDFVDGQRRRSAGAGTSKSLTLLRLST